MENLLAIESIILFCLMLFMQYDALLHEETQKNHFGMGALLYDTLFFRSTKALTVLIEIISIIIFSVRFKWWYSIIYIAANYIVMLLIAILILRPIVRAVSRFFFGMKSGFYFNRDEALATYCIDKGRLLCFLAVIVLDIWLIVLWFL